MDPLAKPNSVLDYVSPFPKNISADEWIPEIEEEVDDTPPLIDDLDSDSDSEESDSEDSSKCVHRCAISMVGPFNCPVPGCPKAFSKSWKNAASLQDHLADYVVGKFQGSIPK